jgi:hypothetical protein
MGTVSGSQPVKCAASSLQTFAETMSKQKDYIVWTLLGTSSCRFSNNVDY